MKGLLYRLTRDLHLYFGLFISPFVLVFSVSVFFFVHAWTSTTVPETTRVVSSLDLRPDLATLSGRPLVDALKPILGRLNVRGEIGFVQKNVPEETLLIPISIPGRAISVRLHLGRREAIIVTRETGLADALMTLHKSPGGHGPDIRMNWFAMKAWRWFADATVYLTLFITISGLYLWVMLRAERRVGLILLFTGTVTFFGIAYAVSH